MSNKRMLSKQCRVGIFDCDVLHDSLKKEYDSYSHMLQSLFKQVDPFIEFVTYSVIDGIYPEDDNECDAYLITGSKSSAYDPDPWIHALKERILRLAAGRHKMVGICFGHQLLAHTLGGLTSKSDKGWGVGAMSSDVLTHPQWLEPKQPFFSLLVSHQDQVTQLPPGAERIATSDFCKNSAFQIDDYVLGFQGHPEFTRGYSRRLMELRRDRIPSDVIDSGMDSLTTQTDYLLVAQWIVNFIRSDNGTQ